MLIYCWLQTVYHDDLFHTISLHGLCGFVTKSWLFGSETLVRLNGLVA